MTPYATLQDKLCALEGYFRELGSVVVCFSGGVDSALLLAVAHRVLGERAVGLLALSPSLAPTEHQAAVALAEQLGAVLQALPSHELDDADYAANAPDRCYHCKRELARLALQEQAQRGFAAVVYGANLDDRDDYRPGERAAREAGIRSPLMELGLGKEDVRALARHLELPVWDKPAAACLASRLPYGTAVTAERLTRIAGFEAALKQLGFRQIRVRFHDAVARIELGPDELGRAVVPELRERIVQAGQDHGFVHVALDLAGYRRGSLNEALGR